MIAKKIPNPKKSASKAERTAGVVGYITEPETQNNLEKCVHCEAVNFISDDLQSQIKEMTALAMEVVKSKDPIKHYVLSWKQNEMPTPAQARQAADLFIKHLGLEGHQYVIGLHDDTDNRHLHIAVNCVNPHTLRVTKINKGFDLEAAHQAIAIIERIQGWSVEANARYRTDDHAKLLIDPKTKRPKIFENKAKAAAPTPETTQAARDKELQTGEKSAQRIGIENAPAIIENAKSWADLHAKMRAAGMEYMRQGSGAAIKVGDTLVKASGVVDRKNNFGALQKRFGLYQPANHPEITNDPLNRTKLVTDDRFTTGFDQPHAQPARLDTFHALRHLSGRDMARHPSATQSKAANPHLLQSDESASRRRIDGVRWRGDSPAASATTEHSAADKTNRTDIVERHRFEIFRDFGKDDRTPIRSDGVVITTAATDNSKRTQNSSETSVLREHRSERLDDRQHGWDQYKQIKTANDAAKAAHRLAMQKRHNQERSDLYEHQKAHRTEYLAKVPKGDGQRLNLMRSLLSVEQAPEKLELQKKHAEERKQLYAKYQKILIYREWKEQPLILAPAHISHKIPEVITILKNLTHSVDRYGHITYQLNDKDIFRDEGKVIMVLDTNYDAGIAAALAVAQQKFGQVLTVTGSDDFQRQCVKIAVDNNLTCRFDNPELEKVRVALQQQKYQQERTTTSTAAPGRPQRTATRTPTQSNNQDVLIPDPRTTTPSTAPAHQHHTLEPEAEPQPHQDDRRQQIEDGPGQRYSGDDEIQLEMKKRKAAAVPTPTPAKADQPIDDIDPGQQYDGDDEHQQPEQPPIDYQADIQQQLMQARRAATHSFDPAKKPYEFATPDDYTKQSTGPIIVSNAELVAVSTGKQIKIYKIAELAKNIDYDGAPSDSTAVRYAPGNWVDLSHGKTYISEQREDKLDPVDSRRPKNNDLGRF